MITVGNGWHTRQPAALAVVGVACTLPVASLPSGLPGGRAALLPREAR